MTPRLPQPGTMKAAARKIYETKLAPAYVRLCSLPSIRNRLAPWLRGMPTWVEYSPSGRGLSRTAALQYLDRRGALRGKRVLIIGRDTPGTLIPDLFKHGVSSITMAELLVDEEMAEILSEWKKAMATYPGRVHFMGGDGTQLALRSGMFDLAYSESVLEHVGNVAAFLDETLRVLKPGGYVHALFGPLWYTHGGPHIGELGYDHLLNAPEAFLEAARKVGNWWQVLFVERDLFNRMNIDDYLVAFEERFTVLRCIVAGSPEGERFRQEHAAEWATLRAEYSERTLLTRLAAVTAERI